MKTRPPAGKAPALAKPELASTVVAAPADAMRLALAAAQRGRLAGEPPVGACVVQDGEVIATAHTSVIAGPDATAHAEVLALRSACRHARTASLEGCELVVTVEPCAMCLAAAHYAGIDRVWFGVGLDTMQAVTGRELRGVVPDGMTISGGILAGECAALLKDWAAGLGRRR